MIEQVELVFYVEGKRRPITSLTFESIESCKEFIESMEGKDFITCSDIVIQSRKISHVKIVM